MSMAESARISAPMAPQKLTRAKRLAQWFSMSRASRPIKSGAKTSCTTAAVARGT
jgi:hypothetical protein